MASQDSALRLRFLQNSASLLSSQSVASAAHLMSLHNRFLHEDAKSIKSRQHESWCGACGSPRKDSHTKVAKIKQRAGKGKSRPVSKGAVNGVVVYKCLRCSRRTIQQDRRLQTRAQQQKPSGISTATSSISVASASTGGQSGLDMASTSEVSTKTTLENASSKRRAKARKQGGLQALLASKRSQESNPSGSSLDLFDFLQQ